MEESETAVYGAENWATDDSASIEQKKSSPKKRGKNVFIESVQDESDEVSEDPTPRPSKKKKLEDSTTLKNTKTSSKKRRQKRVYKVDAKRLKTVSDEPDDGPVENPYPRPGKKTKLDDAAIHRLEKNVLGDGSALLKSLTVPDSDSGLDAGDDDDSEYSDTLGSSERKPAWHDDDDDKLVSVSDVVKMKRTRRIPLGLKPTSDYQKFLRKKFTDVYGEPSWAKLDNKRPEHDDPDLAILRSSGKMVEKPNYLAKGVIQIKRLAALNTSTRAEGPVLTTVRFHPTTNVALVAGLGCRASLIQVDGAKNNKLACVHFDKFPIRCARFAENGNEFVVGSNLHSHFFVYDMLRGASIKIPVHHNTGQSNMSRFEMSPDGKFIAVVGKFGQIHLLTANSKEWVGSMSMNGSVNALCFAMDSKTLYSYGDQGEVYVWDIGTRRLLHKFQDEGSIKGVSLATSPCGSYIAAGSSSGVVNLYDSNVALKQPYPTPLKAVMNLVTSATTLNFNHSSQVLAISSSAKANSVKLLHLPSFTVFKNFPNTGVELNCIQDCAFSPNSGYFGLASNRHIAHLFRLRYFGNY